MFGRYPAEAAGVALCAASPRLRKASACGLSAPIANAATALGVVSTWNKNESQIGVVNRLCFALGQPGYYISVDRQFNLHWWKGVGGGYHFFYYIIGCQYFKFLRPLSMVTTLTPANHKKNPYLRRGSSGGGCILAIPPLQSSAVDGCTPAATTTLPYFIEGSCNSQMPLPVWLCLICLLKESSFPILLLIQIA